MIVLNESVHTEHNATEHYYLHDTIFEVGKIVYGRFGVDNLTTMPPSLFPHPKNKWIHTYAYSILMRINVFTVSTTI